ncbi:WcbI family polysaccharide biosynthesis putative acetyltransferase [Methylobacterium sp. J-076]|uniref:WcbI family polysaccharide biosynthesis putative acetyltransferase n=1 Tax=Methylobacterium sp. J-076 TaxID=2836655 RepID=UPI001FB9D55B|nr:WcbI family polysaccharide biosynthesis putative acetyltransferase [Methylobacterium sp. J-076]MCJ2015637.1 WcbI family polysaccharide biosynthesis putative acetyltransferase [Methylobacterium sp. J-076]
MPSLDTVRRAQYWLSQIGKPRGPRAPRLLVLGVCQAGTVAKAMRYLLPDAQVDFLSVFSIGRGHRRLSDLIARADRYDAVFTHIYLPPFRDGGTILDLRARPNVYVIPTIAFAAYHPDVVSIGVQDHATLRGLLSGPMGHSHSAVTLYAYLAGFSEAQALRLFCEPVFERLGYYAFWDESVASLRRLGAEAGYDLDTHLTRWARRGCFMHSTNHPKLYVMADIARGLLDKAGIPFDACDLDAFLPDDLGGMGSWPVYPEIGQHYGVPGSALFFKAETPRSGPARTMTRAAYIAAAYAYYERRPRDVLVSQRVQAWRGDPATVDFLRVAAGPAPDAAPQPAGGMPFAAGRRAGHAPDGSIVAGGAGRLGRVSARL